MNARLETPPRLITQAVDWEAVYWEYLPRVYNFFRYRVGDDALAEDLTATTFTKAWRARDQYAHDIATFSTWLFSIARHVVADHFRQHHAEIPLDDVHHLNDAQSLEQTVQQRSDFTRLAELLNQLPAREREIIALKYGAEMTNRAIAKLTGLSESNVGTILSRTIQKLRRVWDSES